MKTTKKAKRIIALAAALSLSACMFAMPAGMVFADNTITITDEAGYTHTQGYVAYQIFAGKYENDQLIVNGWGNGINVTSFVSALKSNYKKADNTNPFDIDAIKTDDDNVSTAANAQAVADIVATLDENSNDAEAFARLALKHSKYGNTSAEHKSGSGDDANKISGLSDGYYVVADKAAATKDGNSAFTLGMLVAGGNQTVTTKIGYPEVVKKVEENSEVPGYSGMGESEQNNYNDVADYNIGDAVPFKLYGTMPSNLDEYGAYYYKFTDTLAKGFTKPGSVTIKIGNNVIKQNDGNTRVKIIENADKTTAIIVSFEDIKKCQDNNGNTVSVNTDSIVTVEYKAVLNSSAVIGTSGNENSVHLSYLNNPNVEYTPNTTDSIEDRPNYPYTPDNPQTEDDEEENPTNNPDDGNPYDDKYVPPAEDDKDDNSPDDGTPSDNNISETPEDKVVVYTYELDVTKMDAINHNTKLDGAVFILSKTEESETKYAKIDGSNKITEWVKVDGTAPDKEQMLASGFDSFSILTSDSDGLIKIIGLDAGTYTLTEIKAPDNYNDPGSNDTIEFTIDATIISERQNWTNDNALTALSVKKTDGNLINSLENLNQKTNIGATDTGIVSFDVYNTKGATLPSTGGIGTTIFLLTGGTAAGAAAILYITKKRTSANAE